MYIVQKIDLKCLLIIFREFCVDRLRTRLSLGGHHCPKVGRVCTWSVQFYHVWIHVTPHYCTDTRDPSCCPFIIIATSLTSGNHHLLSISLILSFQECYISGIIQYIIFGDWFVSTQYNALEICPSCCLYQQFVLIIVKYTQWIYDLVLRAKVSFWRYYLKTLFYTHTHNFHISVKLYGCIWNSN